MDLSEWEDLQPIPSWEPSALHATKPFARNLGTVSHLNAPTDDTTDATIAIVFLEIMSDNVSNADQNAELALASQTKSSRASPDSTNPVEATCQSNVWPPVEVTGYSLDGCSNSNIRLANEQTTTSEWIQQTGTRATPK